MENVPIIYGCALVAIGLAFLLFCKKQKNKTQAKTVSQMLKSLKSARVWRFGAYYFLVWLFCSLFPMVIA